MSINFSSLNAVQLSEQLADISISLQQAFHTTNGVPDKGGRFLSCFTPQGLISYLNNKQIRNPDAEIFVNILMDKGLKLVNLDKQDKLVNSSDELVNLFDDPNKLVNVSNKPNTLVNSGNKQDSLVNVSNKSNTLVNETRLYLDMELLKETQISNDHLQRFKEKALKSESKKPKREKKKSVRDPAWENYFSNHRLKILTCNVPTFSVWDLVYKVIIMNKVYFGNAAAAKKHYFKFFLPLIQEVNKYVTIHFCNIDLSTLDFSNPDLSKLNREPFYDAFGEFSKLVPILDTLSKTRRMSPFFRRISDVKDQYVSNLAIPGTNFIVDDTINDAQGQWKKCKNICVNIKGVISEMGQNLIRPTAVVKANVVATKVLAVSGCQIEKSLISNGVLVEKSLMDNEGCKIETMPTRFRLLNPEAQFEEICAELCSSQPLKSAEKDAVVESLNDPIKIDVTKVDYKMEQVDDPKINDVKIEEVEDAKIEEVKIEELENTEIKEVKYAKVKENQEVKMEDFENIEMEEPERLNQSLEEGKLEEDDELEEMEEDSDEIKLFQIEDELLKEENQEMELLEERLESKYNQSEEELKEIQQDKVLLKVEQSKFEQNLQRVTRSSNYWNSIAECTRSSSLQKPNKSRKRNRENESDKRNLKNESRKRNRKNESQESLKSNLITKQPHFRTTQTEPATKRAKTEKMNSAPSKKSIASRLKHPETKHSKHLRIRCNHCEYNFPGRIFYNHIAGHSAKKCSLLALSDRIVLCKDSQYSSCTVAKHKVGGCIKTTSGDFSNPICLHCEGEIPNAPLIQHSKSCSIGWITNFSRLTCTLGQKHSNCKLKHKSCFTSYTVK